eukprot:TRINITY_DN28671_c0_g1_i1.p1 TRINITY_DN28671_c0_g1~~TRINITY_DN28671_c0_g1_i1.p1  ORF type:complete len:810 (-),score=84.06 TRINITY_DN28671_c0_g1_i1:22-2451(-)
MACAVASTATPFPGSTADAILELRIAEASREVLKLQMQRDAFDNVMLERPRELKSNSAAYEDLVRTYVGGTSPSIREWQSTFREIHCAGAPQPSAAIVDVGLGSGDRGQSVSAIATADAVGAYCGKHAGVDGDATLVSRSCEGEQDSASDGAGIVGCGRSGAGACTHAKVFSSASSRLGYDDFSRGVLPVSTTADCIVKTALGPAPRVGQKAPHVMLPLPISARGMGVCDGHALFDRVDSHRIGFRKPWRHDRTVRPDADAEFTGFCCTARNQNRGGRESNADGPRSNSSVFSRSERIRFLEAAVARDGGDTCPGARLTSLRPTPSRARCERAVQNRVENENSWDRTEQIPCATMMRSNLGVSRIHTPTHPGISTGLSSNCRSSDCHSKDSASKASPKEQDASASRKRNQTEATVDAGAHAEVAGRNVEEHTARPCGSRDIQPLRDSAKREWRRSRARSARAGWGRADTVAETAASAIAQDGGVATTQNRSVCSRHWFDTHGLLTELANFTNGGGHTSSNHGCSALIPCSDGVRSGESGVTERILDVIHALEERAYHMRPSDALRALAFMTAAADRIQSAGHDVQRRQSYELQRASIADERAAAVVRNAAQRVAASLAATHALKADARYVADALAALAETRMARQEDVDALLARLLVLLRTDPKRMTPPLVARISYALGQMALLGGYGGDSLCARDGATTGTRSANQRAIEVLNTHVLNTLPNFLEDDLAGINDHFAVTYLGDEQLRRLLQRTAQLRAGLRPATAQHMEALQRLEAAIRSRHPMLVATLPDAVLAYCKELAAGFVIDDD